MSKLNLVHCLASHHIISEMINDKFQCLPIYKLCFHNCNLLRASKAEFFLVLHSLSTLIKDFQMILKTCNLNLKDLFTIIFNAL